MHTAARAKAAQSDEQLKTTRAHVENVDEVDVVVEEAAAAHALALLQLFAQLLARRLVAAPRRLLARLAAVVRVLAAHAAREVLAERAAVVAHVLILRRGGGALETESHKVAAVAHVATISVACARAVKLLNRCRSMQARCAALDSMQVVAHALEGLGRRYAPKAPRMSLEDATAACLPTRLVPTHGARVHAQHLRACACRASEQWRARALVMLQMPRSLVLYPYPVMLMRGRQPGMYGSSPGRVSSAFCLSERAASAVLPTCSAMNAMDAGRLHAESLPSMTYTTASCSDLLVCMSRGKAVGAMVSKVSKLGTP